jgi:hypothetical protein
MNDTAACLNASVYGSMYSNGAAPHERRTNAAQ